MKKAVITVLAMIFGISVCMAQNLDGFTQTKTGLHYKFHIKTDNPRAQLGDIIIAEIWAYLDDELEYANIGGPEPMFQVMESQHPGDLMEALQMIGKGDSVTFVFNMDTLRKYNPPGSLDGIKSVFYTIKVEDVYTEDEFWKKMEEDQIRGEAEEATKLKAFISEQGITVEPNDDGVFVIITTEGDGRPISRGETITINYVGRFLDGTIFDTSLEDIAKEHDIYKSDRSYEPLSFQVGAGRIIPGMDYAVLGMKTGTKATLIIPSNMAYGSRAQGTIPAFSTLIFDIEIVDVTSGTYYDLEEEWYYDEDEDYE
ncbi:MAG: FKBP-type peptidyl-prolyl cis-trans isomerase [Bacteroidales bacterium]|jgi:FKBP-type peptidyl-prolyl cis-trans isomerase|nr:FKBP-type peptidyl-prolyl cis-trans isomerase [Bacteroidales bacterium]